MEFVELTVEIEDSLASDLCPRTFDPFSILITSYPEGHMLWTSRAARCVVTHACYVPKSLDSVVMERLEASGSLEFKSFTELKAL